MPATYLGRTVQRYVYASTGGAFAHTPPAGTNLLLFLLDIEFSASGQACTWDGGAVTAINNVTDGGGDSIFGWFFRNPAAGVSKNVNMSWATSRDAVGWVIDVRAAHPVIAPTGTTATGTSAAPSVNAACVVNGLVIDNVVTNNPAVPTAQGAGQTLLEINYRMGASYRLAAANPQTMSWTLSGSDAWAMMGIYVPGVGSSSQLLIMAAERWKGFLRDLKGGLVPPDMLRRRYRDLVTI